MSSIYYLTTTRRESAKTPATPPELPAINFDWLDDWLQTFHTPTGAYSSSLSVTSHLECIQAMWAAYRDNNTPPYKDGLYYYDFSQNLWEGYYYQLARGITPHPSWLTAADAATNCYLKSITDHRYLNIYHFPGGMFLSQDAGRVLTPAQFSTACEQYVWPMAGNIMVNGNYARETISRETARLMEWFFDYFRINGHADARYKTNNTYWGARYHFGASNNLGGHFYDWLRAWSENPIYPPFTGGPFTGPIDYMWRSHDITDSQGTAVRNFGPFMTQFSTRALMRLYGEDANYQTQGNMDWIRECLDLEMKPRDPPGNGCWDATTGYGQQICRCSNPNDPALVAPTTPHAYCDWASPGSVWGYRYQTSLSVTAFHLLNYAWAYKIFGDPKYINRFADVWRLFENNVSWLNARTRNDTWGGKETNQVCWNLFAALNVAGYMNFKTHLFPNGYPYQTPPPVSPSP